MSRPHRTQYCAVLCAATAGFLDLYMTQALYPELAARFDVGAAGAGALVTATTIGVAIASPAVGLVVERLGTRRMMLFGLAMLACLSILVSMANTWAELLAVRFAQGLTIPIVLSSTLAAIHERWEGSRALAASTFFVTGTVLGGVLGRYFPATAVPHLGWNAGFLSFAALHLTLLVAVYLLWRSSAVLGVRNSPQLGARALRAAWSASLRNTSLAGFCLLFSQTAVFTYIGIRLAAPPFGLSSTALGALYVVFLPSLLFLRRTPALIEKWSESGVLKSALCVAWCGLLLTLAHSLWSVIGGLVLFSSAVFVSQAVLAHRLGHGNPASKATAAGIYLFFYYLGGSLGAVLPALAWRSAGWAGCLAILVVVQVGGFAFARARSRPTLLAREI